MGTRSDVGFCVAPDIKVPRFEDIEKDWEFDTIIRDERGTFYFVSEIEWNELYEGTPKSVSKFLESLGSEDYQFVCLTEGSPEVKGERWDNEFDLGYRCEVTYSEE